MPQRRTCIISSLDVAIASAMTEILNTTWEEWTKARTHTHTHTEQIKNVHFLCHQKAASLKPVLKVKPSISQGINYFVFKYFSQIFFYLLVLMRRIAMKLAVTLIIREIRISYKKYKEVHKSSAVCHGHLLIIELRGQANVQLCLIMHINDASRIHHRILFLLLVRRVNAH